MNDFELLHAELEFLKKLCNKRLKVRRSDGWEFSSFKEAAESVGVTSQAIFNSIRCGYRAGGFKWERI